MWEEIELDKLREAGIATSLAPPTYGVERPAGFPLELATARTQALRKFNSRPMLSETIASFSTYTLNVLSR